jgi:hypothetical protein
MPKYLVQLTPEGGPDGTRVVDAHQAVISESGAIAFFDADDDLIAAFNSFQVVVDLDHYATIEADTAALFAESTD